MYKTENSMRVTNTITVINSLGEVVLYNLWNESNNCWVNSDYLPINFTASIASVELKLNGVKSGDFIKPCFKNKEGKEYCGPTLLFEDEGSFSSAVLRLKRIIDDVKVSLIL